MEREKLRIIFPFYADWGGFEEETISDLKDQPVLMEFYDQLEDVLNYYINNPAEKNFEKLMNSFIKLRGCVFNKTVQKLIKALAKKESVKHVYLIDTSTKTPPTSTERNIWMIDNIVKYIKEFKDEEEFYVFTAFPHVKLFLRWNEENRPYSLNNKIKEATGLEYIKFEKLENLTRILTYGILISIH